MGKKILDQVLDTFTTNSKAEWEEKASIDLKGKELSSLNWKINPEINQAPYFTASDVSGIDHAILKTNDPDWQIGQEYLVTDYAESNKELLADLMHGLNAPVITFSCSPSLKDLEVLFEGVGLEHIYTHFRNDDNNLEQVWSALLKKRKVAADAYFYAGAMNLPTKSKCIAAADNYYGKENVHLELKQALESARQELGKSLDKQKTAKQLFFHFSVNNSYLLNLAKIRAFKVIWIKEMQQLGLEESLPFISVSFAAEAYSKDEHDNLINATSMAMSAVLGGANHLVVRPTNDNNTAKRLARNVQLVLKHESGLHKVPDPAYGSFYIESLTSKLVNWVADNS